MSDAQPILSPLPTTTMKKITTAEATLDRYRSHPGVQSITIEATRSGTYYWINLKPGYSTDYGIGERAGSERSLRGVGSFLRTVAADRN